MFNKLNIVFQIKENIYFSLLQFFKVLNSVSLFVALIYEKKIYSR